MLGVVTLTVCSRICGAMSAGRPEDFARACLTPSAAKDATGKLLQSADYLFNPHNLTLKLSFKSVDGDTKEVILIPIPD